MSSANRGAERAENDFYETPGWCVEALLPRLKLPENPVVFDPGCGSGAILDVFLAKGSATYGTDIDRDLITHCNLRGHKCIKHDFLADQNLDMCEGLNLIIANPPFSHAIEFVDACLAMRRAVSDRIYQSTGDACAEGPTVAVLMRLSMLSGQKRKEYWATHPCDVYVLSRRPSFTGGGTDSCDYAWFVFWGFMNRRWDVL